MNVFTYGTLMNKKVIKNIVKADFESVDATLEGYVRKKVKERVYPGITALKDSTVNGKLWLNVTPNALTKLDYF
mgnify:CR=1 FL=1